MPNPPLPTLRHIHLPTLVPFPLAERLQSHLVQQNLLHKSFISTNPTPNPLPPAPIPTILTFSPTPVYTTGRRELGTLTPTQILELKTPLKTANGKTQIAEVVQTLRGGQITFHGPGQLVIYPILDLRGIKSERWPKGIGVRCFVHELEEATIRMLGRWGVKGGRTENAGVWVRFPGRADGIEIGGEEGGIGEDGGNGEERKIASLGVHLRRNVSSYGVGLNVRTDLAWFDRIVACGLEGKKMVNLKDVLREEERRNKEGEEVCRVMVGEKGEIFPRTQLKMRFVAEIWAREFARGLWGKEGEDFRLLNMPDAAVLALLKTVVGEEESSGLLDTFSILGKYGQSNNS